MDPGTPQPRPLDPQQAAEEVLRACRSLGFAAAGIVEAAESSRPDALRSWLADGKHGDMAWMAEHLGERIDPRRLLTGARSVVVVADRYARPGARAESLPGSARGRVAKYAQGRDYHDQMRKRLGLLVDRLRREYPGQGFRLFVDTGPVLEREHAARAGLGFVGKNTLLIDPHAGSFLLLGGLVTTLEMAEAKERSGPATSPTSHCGACTRCIDACPTRAITEFSVDARRCISYLTIEHEGLIDPEFHEAMGDWVFGCDVCQDVCPFNSAEHAGARAGVNPAYRSRLDRGGGSFDLLEILGWTVTQRQERLGGTAATRASLSMIRRNAAIAAGNSVVRDQSSALLDRLREMAGTEAEDPLVSATCRQVLARIDPQRRCHAQE